MCIFLSCHLNSEEMNKNLRIVQFTDTQNFQLCNRPPPDSCQQNIRGDATVTCVMCRTKDTGLYTTH
jgi:hypothetical protein